MCCSAARSSRSSASSRISRKLSPLAGFKRMFGVEGLINLVKGLLKIAIVGVAIWTQLWPERGMLEAMLDQSPGASWAT